MKRNAVIAFVLAFAGGCLASAVYGFLQGAWPFGLIELFWTGDFVDAREAERLGLVNKVLPDAELMPFVRGVAAKIAAAPALSVRFIKRAVQQGMRSDLRSNLDLISSHYAVVTAGADHREAVEAFIAKRKPVFE